MAVGCDVIEGGWGSVLDAISALGCDEIKDGMGSVFDAISAVGCDEIKDGMGYVFDGTLFAFALLFIFLFDVGRRPIDPLLLAAGGGIAAASDGGNCADKIEGTDERERPRRRERIFSVPVCRR